MDTNTIQIVNLINHWSKVFNLPVSLTKNFPPKRRLKLDIALIKEEFKEIKEAVKNDDLKEYQDGLGDLLWVIVRAMLSAGIDPGKTIEAIYHSNMSKADRNLLEATQTAEFYKEQGVETFHKVNDGFYLTFRKSDKKLLKGRSFKEPIF